MRDNQWSKPGEPRCSSRIEVAIVCIQYTRESRQKYFKHSISIYSSSQKKEVWYVVSLDPPDFIIIVRKVILGRTNCLASRRSLNTGGCTQLTSTTTYLCSLPRDVGMLRILQVYCIFTFSSLSKSPAVSGKVVMGSISPLVDDPWTPVVAPNWLRRHHIHAQYQEVCMYFVFRGSILYLSSYFYPISSAVDSMYV